MEIIVRNRAALLTGAKRVYVSAARAANRSLLALGAEPEHPEHIRRFSHWAYSLTCAHNPLAISRLGVPWWSYRSIDTVDYWLASRSRPIRVFEYGAGASTIWLAQRADEVYSVEHHQGFADYMSPLLMSLPTVKLIVEQPVPGAQPKTPSAKEGNENLDFTSYVAAIDQVEGVFDLVVIDGRARSDCLARATRRLAGDGIIVFDNSARRRYRGAIVQCGLVEQRFRGLVPTLPYPDQTSVLRRPRHAG